MFMLFYNIHPHRTFTFFDGHQTELGPVTYHPSWVFEYRLVVPGAIRAGCAILYLADDTKINNKQCHMRHKLVAGVQASLTARYIRNRSKPVEL